MITYLSIHNLTFNTGEASLLTTTDSAKRTCKYEGGGFGCATCLLSKSPTPAHTGYVVDYNTDATPAVFQLILQDQTLEQIINITSLEYIITYYQEPS